MATARSKKVSSNPKSLSSSFDFKITLYTDKISLDGINMELSARLSILFFTVKTYLIVFFPKLYENNLLSKYMLNSNLFVAFFYQINDFVGLKCPIKFFRDYV